MQRNTAVIQGGVQAQSAAVSGSVHGFAVSSNIDELKKQFLECKRQLPKTESENESLRQEVKEQRDELIELRAYRENRFEQNRANARKSKGVKKDYKQNKLIGKTDRKN